MSRDSGDGCSVVEPESVVALAMNCDSKLDLGLDLLEFELLTKCASLRTSAVERLVDIKGTAASETATGRGLVGVGSLMSETSLEAHSPN